MKAAQSRKIVICGILLTADVIQSAMTYYKLLKTQGKAKTNYRIIACVLNFGTYLKTKVLLKVTKVECH